MAATMHYNKTESKPNEPTDKIPLSEHVKQILKSYFNSVGEWTTLDEAPSDLYQLVISEVEVPLLETVMRYTNYNQSLAAKILGLNRGTFRKKLEYYGMLRTRRYFIDDED